MIERLVIHSKISGQITVYKDDMGKYVVAVSVNGQKSPYPKLFLSSETAVNHAQWISDNWQYHVKSVDYIKTTPLTYK